MADTDPIDPQALASMLQMVSGDSSFLAEMIDTYLADSPQLLAEAGQAVAAGDTELLRRTAHSLKSNSEQFGATALAALARRLEQLGKDGALEGAAALLADAAAEYERVELALIAARPES